MKFDSAMIPVLLATFSPALIFFLAISLDRRKRKHVEKSPQTEKLLRPPGYSLSNLLEKTIDALLNDLLAASLLAAFSGTGVFALAGFLGASAPALFPVVCLLITLPFIAGCLWTIRRAFQRFKLAQNIRLGISGEQAVAEAIGEAADSGFRAFHDLPGGENWNIDHVAVGPRGVFLVETKAYRRRGSPNKGQQEHEIDFDGQILIFPTFKTDKPLKQASRNAKWLSNYLENKTGKPVWVKPLVVFPGWMVNYLIKGDFPVMPMNTNYLPDYLRFQNEKIHPAHLRQIITALEEKCQDVQF